MRCPPTRRWLLDCWFAFGLLIAVVFAPTAIGQEPPSGRLSPNRRQKRPSRTRAQRRRRTSAAKPGVNRSTFGRLLSASNPDALAAGALLGRDRRVTRWSGWSPCGGSGSIPRDFVERFLERLATGKLDRDRAAELCKANDSPVARVFAHGRQLLGPARGDDPPGARLRRRRRGHRPEAEHPRPERHGDARPAARPARARSSA